jgi:hypothetical protein
MGTIGIGGRALPCFPYIVAKVRDAQRAQEGPPPVPPLGLTIAIVGFQQ